MYMVTYLLTVKLLLEYLINILLSIAQNIHVNNCNVNASSNHENDISYLSRAFNQPFPTINLRCVSSKEIESITKSLKIKNLHGYEGISSKLLKSSIRYISSPLTYICNRMFVIFWHFPNKIKILQNQSHI